MNSLAVWTLLAAISTSPGDLGLTAKIEARRAGRVIALDYQLLEANGRRHVDRQQREKPPEFTVLQNGSPIGSGVFAYG
jgi:hypothetical protein